MKKLFLWAVVLLMTIGAQAQRVTDKLDRGLVAVKSGNGVYCSWRMLGEEYYDVTYNVYRDNTLVASGLTTSNYTDGGGSSSNSYSVSAVVRGVEQQQCTAVRPWVANYKEIKINHGSLKSTYVPNDACCADVDGDGQMEIMLKFDNQSESSNYMQKNGYYGEHSLFEVIKQDGTVLWRVNCGPNMGDFQNNEQNIVAYDWDMDGKAEVLMRLEEGSTIYMADGSTYTIGADGKNGTSWTNYREPRYVNSGGATVAMAFNLSSSATATCSANWVTTKIENGVLYVTAAANNSTTTGRTTTVTVKDGSTTNSYSFGQLYSGQTSVEWFTHYGKEFLVYCNGQTGKPYVVTEFPLKRLESGETDLNKAWGDGYGHRSSKYFFGAPYLDGRKPYIFLARGIYTRHKMIAYSVDPTSHQLTEYWRWNCNDSSSPYYGQGYHNYAIADVDWDGRDEICFGSMVIDDNGKGLSTTGLGHGDAQHHGDFNPYIHGHEIYTCNEDRPDNNYRDATTSKIYYRHTSGNDDGRAMCDNFCNDYPGAMGYSGHDTPISCVTNDHIDGLGSNGVTLNMRIYWDGDLCSESFNGSGTRNSTGTIYKYGRGSIASLAGSLTNNDTKSTPCYQGDLFGDWREEVIMRTSNNNIRIYTTTEATPWRNYTLWHDFQYRQAMVWQMCGYNQPPHVSYFLGELEGITMAPPPLTMTDRTEIKNGGSISNDGQTVITCETGNMTVSVQDGATPYLYIDNTPSWVQGTNSTNTTGNPTINRTYYTHTLTGGAFGGAMRLVKQGDGKLVLPTVTQTYSGSTDVWAGTLQFDGTLQNSRLWLNRHTKLISNGGTFAKGIQADYNATICPGGEGAVGTISADSLILNFGSRVVIDFSGDQCDQLTARVLCIDNKVWPKGGGPQYSTPVLQIDGDLQPGDYVLGHFEAIEGNIEDLVIEGPSDKKLTLTYQDGILSMNVQAYEGGLLTWTGAKGSSWDLDATANFVDANGEAAVFVPGSKVTFDDTAKSFTVSVKDNVAPAEIVFNNSKSYNFSGSPILGEPTLTKSGTGNVQLKSNNQMGNTIIDGGLLTVSALANNSGTEYGALGTVDKTITIRNGAILALSETATSNHRLLIGNGGGAISVASGKTLTQSGNIAGNGQTLTKKGAGTLGTPAGMGVKRLVIQQGTVQATENNNVTSLPDTVEFQGGTLKDPNSYGGNVSTTNRANFVVPAGKTGTFYSDGRANYQGKLIGSGTFNVYSTFVRCYFQGNWSAFEGTVTANTFKSGSYDPQFIFDNTYGLPKATLKVNSGVTFDNNGKSMSIGSVTGTGTLGGSGTYTLGTSGKNINVTFSATTPIIKAGEGIMTANTAGLLTKTVTVKAGELRFDVGDSTTPVFGGALTAEGTARIVGSGLLASLVMKSGTQFTLRSVELEEMGFGDVVPSTVKSTASMNFNAGSTLVVAIASNSEYSTLEPTFLTMNGTLQLILSDDYKPKVGDTFTLWTVKNTFSGTPKFDLPTLPRGMGWDTTGLAAKTGVLAIVESEFILGDVNNDGEVGIGDIVAITNVMAGIETNETIKAAADVNGDGEVGIGDIVAVTNIMAGIN